MKQIWSFKVLLFTIWYLSVIISSQTETVFNVLIGGITKTNERNYNFQITGQTTLSSLYGIISSSDGTVINTEPNFTKQKENYFIWSFTDVPLLQGTTYKVDITQSKDSTPELATKTFRIPNDGKIHFIATSNADSNTHSFLLDKIKKQSDVDFLMFLGNIHSNPKDIDDETEYLNKYNKYWFDNKDMKSMIEERPFYYTFNDLDFAGSKSNANSKGVNAINKAYRTLFPNTIPSNQTKGIYQSFTIGKALFIMTDTRSFLDTGKKHLFGTEQYNWLKQQFHEALGSSDIASIIITVTQPWNYVDEEYNTDIIKQGYKSLLDEVAEEKNVFFDALKEKNTNFYQASKVWAKGSSELFKNILLIVGERHWALDNGNWNNYGSFPIVVCGPLSSWQQCRGGPYSHGSFQDTKTQYCDITILQDQLQTGGLACIIIKGILASDDELIGDQIVFAYNTCDPESFKGRLNRKCPMDWKEKLIHAAITIVFIVFVAFLFFFYFYWRSVNVFALKYTKIKQE